MTPEELRGWSCCLYCVTLTSMGAWTAFESFGEYEFNPHHALLKAVPCALLFFNALLRMPWFADTCERPYWFQGFLSSSFLFHGLGDYLLANDEPYPDGARKGQAECSFCFTVGLGSFLIGHVLNVAAFSSDGLVKVGSRIQASPPPLRLDLAVPFVLYAGSILAVLFLVGPGSTGKMLGESTVMSIAVPIYGVILASCPWRAFARRGAFLESGALWLVVGIGYCIYALSDSCLSLMRFSHSVPEPWRTIIVMITYWSGQLLISLACDVKQPEASILWPWIQDDFATDRSQEVPPHEAKAGALQREALLP